MSADFWAGYISGAAGIIIGNPLDLVKVRLQAGTPIAASSPRSVSGQFNNAGALIRGVTAPILGYGALNALLFVSYNRTLALFGDDPSMPTNVWKAWCAGAVGGLATWVVSTPTELIKCRAQLSNNQQSSWDVTKEVWKNGGLRGFYFGGGVTSIRDAVGYGFYFWSYELSKQWMTSKDDSERQAAMKVLLCGGLAGVVTWTSVFPLDVIKTRVQMQPNSGAGLSSPTTEQGPLLGGSSQPGNVGHRKTLGAISIARQAYQSEGIRVFFHGIGVCSLRAFIVNAIQWAVYEWIMQETRPA